MFLFLCAVFWFSVFIVCYTYLGYAVVLPLMVMVKEALKGRPELTVIGELPRVTLLVAAYNEKDYVNGKVQNSLALDYPRNKLKMIWVTDGSDDGTPDLLKQYPDITVAHMPDRNGKINAINRGMKLVDTPIVIFSDANSMMSSDAVMRIVRLFSDPKVGCVSGEKRIVSNVSDVAAGTGESLYWRYESFLKRFDARLYSVVGAAGELFAIRRELFTEMEKDTILDDLMISLRIAMRGYVTQYDARAYACEMPSANIREELRRKIRIAAGGFQSIIRLVPLLNIFKYSVLSFQYISHRVLRWTLAPLCLLLLFTSSTALACKEGFFSGSLYAVLFWLQMLFYAMALAGCILENRHIKLKIFFVPYYFFIMNLSVYLGFFRYLRKQQDVRWERAKRR